MKSTEPLFATSLPTLPRRHIIQSNLKNSRIFRDEDDDELNSATIRTNDENNNDSDNNNALKATAQESFSSFRRADSTSRTLADISKKKYEVMERRRAGMLVIILFLCALTIHFTTSDNNNTDRDQFINNANNSPHETSSAVILSNGNNNNIHDHNYKIWSRSKQTNDEEVKGVETTNQDIEEEEEQPGLEYLYAVKNMRNINDGMDRNDIPFFWHIPRCAGSTIKAIMGECLGLILACEVGVRDGHEDDPSLDIINYKGARYMNVDTSSLEGINRARDKKLVGSNVARPQAIVSSYLLPISQEIYDHSHKGRAFTLLRHPIERAVSMYYFNHQIGNLANEISLEDYAKGQGIENNWMVRYLTGKLEDELPSDALFEAKNNLKKKFLIGFVDDLNESIQRFLKYNDWAYHEYDMTKATQQEQCVNMLAEVGANKNMAGYVLPKRGSQLYSWISWQTSYDIKLYEYAKELFDTQTKLWGTKERKKADKKKKRLGGS